MFLVLSYVQCFLYLVSSSINVSIFHYMAEYLPDRSHMYRERQEERETELHISLSLPISLYIIHPETEGGEFEENTMKH